MDTPLTDAAIVQAIPDTLPVGIWVARAPSGEFVYANAAFQEIMGTAGRDDVAVGEYAEPYGIYDTEGALYPEERMPFVRAIAAGTTIMADDIVIHRTDGRKVHVRAYAHPVRVGEVIDHVVIAFFDISREVEAERARQASERQLHRTQRMESIGNLAGGIAHDFNNLLGAIRTIATSLREQAEDEGLRDALDTIDAATISAQQLTSSLLGFAGGEGNGEEQPVDLDAVVRRVATLLERALDPRHELVLELGQPPAVLGGASRLEQVVMNLALNARDAMPDGGRITVRTTHRDERVLLSVRDEGPGIAEADRERIFEPYFSTRQRGTGRGVGLGLATVYGIVAAHGGRVTVVPSARGAHLEVALPAAAGEAPAEPTSTEAPAEAAQTRLTVLVVDDEPLVAKAAGMALRALGHSSILVDSGADAVAAYVERGAEIDCVLLDLAMPGMDGRATAKALLRLDTEARILLASGYALEEQMEELRALGVSGFLAKPYGLSQLREALGAVMG